MMLMREIVINKYSYIIASVFQFGQDDTCRFSTKTITEILVSVTTRQLWKIFNCNKEMKVFFGGGGTSAIKETPTSFSPAR